MSSNEEALASTLFGIVNGIAIGSPPAAKVWICGTTPPTNGGGMNDSFPSNSAGSPSDGQGRLRGDCVEKVGVQSISTEVMQQ
jgi:hypothetical protein